MSRKKGVYDTRYFIEYFYSDNRDVLKSAKAEFTTTKLRYVSTIVLHEFYRINLEREGKEVADLRHSITIKDFKVIYVDEEIAKRSAVLRSRYRIPMADSIIAATAVILNAPIITDDEHIVQVREVKSRWIL